MSRSPRELEQTVIIRLVSDFQRRMERSATKPHPVTGKHNSIAECKADAARHIVEMIYKRRSQMIDRQNDEAVRQMRRQRRNPK